MIRDDATINQIRAADPAQSTWLAANAGSGKTRVLTDRVARLLLRGTRPQNILCLTYTKAAAAEMQNRLFARLGAWAMLPDADLRAALTELGEEPPEGQAGLSRARVLFAQAMEVPGGLRIQTIHAFCAGLLRRFPLEAGVSPDFTEMEERTAALLRAEIADRMAQGATQGVTDAFLAHASGEDLEPVLKEIVAGADLFAAPFDEPGLRSVLDLPEGLSLGGLVADLFDRDTTDLIAALIPILAAGSTTDQAAAEALRAMTGRLGDLPVLERLLLWGASATKNAPYTAKGDRFPTRDTRARESAFTDALDTLMQRVEAARPLRLGLVTLARSKALHDFGHRFVHLYEEAKTRRGLLDFDDLIARARRLLGDPDVAQWVLWKLDGGIDHILVDEAQDTSPGQWAVIGGLAQEFAAGEGARRIERTLFVVGDRKQSIYSFQGADPDGFDAMRHRFAAELDRAGQGLHDHALAHSFRSAPVILRAVDEVFQGPHLSGLGAEAPQHRAFHAGMPGRVDLWPPVPVPEKEEESTDWTAPVDRIGTRHPARILSDRVADAVRDMVEGGVLPGVGGARRIGAGDILILVQRRSDLFHAIIRGLKTRGVKVAGADRLRVGAELAVRDIGALLRFLALAEDNLSLAEALRSPLFGWTEQELYTLAAHRPGPSLWEALRGSGRVDTLAVLDDLRRQADFLRPYDLINRLLVRHDGRRRLLARLGPEAEDGIDALLAQALAHEAGEVPGLTGFVEWMQTDETDFKRPMESRGDAVRVMTVHGSKGLEAPIVILPDCAKRSYRDRDAFLGHRGRAIWPMPKEEATPLQVALRDEARRKDEDERRRLLYVAMTRAEQWLIVAAAGDTGSGGDSWHAMAEEGLTRAGAVAAGLPGGAGLRLEGGDWDVAAATGAEDVAPQSPAPVAVDSAPVVVPEADRMLAPSDLGGAVILPGETDPQEGEAALARGRLIHRLLEFLPAAAPGDRPALARAICAADPDMTAAGGIDGIVTEALALAQLLAPGDLCEVGVAGVLPDGRRIAGLVDRLTVTAERVTITDYKTNRLVPARPEDVPEGILRQMGAYSHMLEAVYPGRTIEALILWTATATVMPLPRALVMAALRRACLP
ncbi:MAG: double-strand break repair helicase AddA [Rubellimicrobium sp.]|nr:double-strand break repair helicase AddA [Rubellimicrobium sp.]